MNPKLLVRLYSKSPFFQEVKGGSDLKIDVRDISGVGDRTNADLLSEYHGIILDTNVDNIFYNPQRVTQFKTYINNTNGFIICVLRKFRGAWGQNSSYAFIDTVIEETLGLKYNDFNTMVSGSSGNITSYAANTVFDEYLKTPGIQWFTSVKESASSEIISLMDNVESESIAFMPKKFSNRVFFIPWIPSAEEFFWKAVSELARELSGSSESAPEWVYAYELPTLREKNIAITEFQKTIDTAEKEKESILCEKNKLIDIRDTLLFRDGIKLQSTVKDVLNEIGISARDGKMGREDVIFELDDKTFVSEVKGLKKSAAERHLNQLNSKKSQYEFELKKKTKGILIVNAWRELPLENRDSNDNPIFPDQMMDVTKMWEFSLLTTQQLFVAYCKHLEGNFKRDEFISKLYETIGRFAGLKEIENYKILADGDQNKNSHQ